LARHLARPAERAAGPAESDCTLWFLVSAMAGPLSSETERESFDEKR
jgi:hypothetical protein